MRLVKDCGLAPLSHPTFLGGRSTFFISGHIYSNYNCEKYMNPRKLSQS